MDIPLSRFQSLSFDEIQRFRCAIPHPEISRERNPMFSRFCLFGGSKWRVQFSRISCSVADQRLKPRPMLKPSKINLDAEEDACLEEVPQITTPVVGLFDGRKLRIPFTRISCSFAEQRMEPRPVLKPSKINLDSEKETCLEELPRISSPVPALCAQIEKLVSQKRYQESLELFEFLECESWHEVGKSTFDALVSACISSNSIRGVKRVFHFMISSGFQPDQYMLNRTLLMHVKCRMMIDAREIFDRMPKRNLVSWNTIISGLVDSGDYMEAFRLFLIMWGKFSDAGTHTFALLIRACAGLELISPGRQLHACALKMGVVGDIFVSCSLINMYFKCGSIEDAQCVFDEMPEKTTVGWNTIISGYAFHGYSVAALDLFHEMQDSGVEIDHCMFSIIIRVCIRLASIELGKEAHAGLVRHGFGADMVNNTALVDFYSKWGRIEDARNVFEKMPRKNILTWNALIAGYGNHGRGIEAVQLFERMLHQGMVPDHITFLAVLSACSYSGLSDRGWEIFESMGRDHQVKPRAMHYACMIELLGREGLLDEALDLIQDAPFDPTVNMWAALLTACRVHNNLVLGKIAAEEVYGLEPEKLGSYIVLLNIYKKSKMLKEAAGVFQTLKRRGLRMLPACTWIEMKKQTHFFVSGDNQHIQTREIYEKLDSLMLDISKHGYVPRKQFLLLDVDEREERMVLHHSERLSIAFGLINTSSSSTALRLVQSHRICVDCHNAIKCIAMVTGREIIVRDSSRFHRFFKDGSCSCRDYW